MTMPNFDPSKLDPKVLMELSQLVRQLPPEQVSRMQTLMHNMMAGFDVRKEMEEFEKTLPANFREKLFSIMASQPIPAVATPEPSPSSADITVHEARITILRAVADGRMSPEEAEKLLFP